MTAMRYKLEPLKPTQLSVFLEKAGVKFDHTDGDDKAEIEGENYFGSLFDSRPGIIAFARSGNDRVSDEIADQINKSRASMILADPVYKDCIKPQPQQLFVFVENPRLEFIRLFQKSIIEYTPEFLTLQEIPSSCTVGPSVQIERGAIIGERVAFLGNNYIAANVRLGDDVEILPGANIGCEGFGFVRDRDGSLINFPHLGGVVIESKVAIGAGCCIDRGNFGDTVLKTGCKLDDLVYVAHNAVIGSHSLICAQVAVSGGVEIGDRCRIAPSVSIRDGITIGDRCLIGIGSCVVKDIPGGKIAYGIPAEIIGDRD